MTKTSSYHPPFDVSLSLGQILMGRPSSLFPSSSPSGHDLGETEQGNIHSTHPTAREREANLVLTCLYFIVEVARRQEVFDREHAFLRASFGESDLIPHPVP